MPEFRGQPGYVHGTARGVGILLANLGTPDAPTTPAVRRYLREFLADPRVIELPRWKWLPILHLFVLTTRPRQSAALYRKVWTPEGSPLLVHTARVARLLEAELRARLETPLHVEVGMRYGNPSTASAVERLAERGCDRILMLPLYPQYSGTTTATAFDGLLSALQRWRHIPEVRTVNCFHDDPGYIAALARSIRESWERHGRGEKLLLTFHGIPRRYFEAGDPYFCHCQKTARLLVEALDIAPDRYLVTFQSLFGKEEWLRPYTDETMKRLGREGTKSIDVVCPGFPVDCLETLEEIDGLNRDFFQHAGGGEYRYIPCLNERPDHIAALAGIALRHLGGWVAPTGEDSRDALAATTSGERQHALAVAAAYPGGIEAR